ncbi:MAG: hypothetical protein JKY65_07195 [Planctomycetes bacterium]|nr:hypothetical protein [Planctomycetota bacterium]
MSRASARLPLPGPVPRLEPRTPEQSALLLLGTSALLAALAASTALYSLAPGWNPLLLAFPLMLLITGWGSLLSGLFHLEGPRRERSVARGRLAVFGLTLILACAPVPASVVFPARTDARAFNCHECGARGHLRGVQNAWGAWIEHSVRLGGQSPTPYGGWSRPRSACDHSANLPWLATPH